MHRYGREAGFTLFEVVLAISTLVLLSLVIVESLGSLSRSSALAATQSRIEALADRVVHAAGRDASFAVWVFEKGAESDDYLDVLDFGEHRPAPWSRLPELVPEGSLGPDDPGTEHTGNMLFLGRHSDVLTLKLDTAPAETRLVRIDRMRFVVYYLTERADGSLDLVRWGSAPIARYADVQQVPDGERRLELIAKLVDHGVRYAWDPGRDRSAGLFSVGEKGLRPLGPNGLVASDASMGRAGLLGTRRAVAVARNGGAHGIAVPAYARASGAFPAGFEVKAVGVPVSKLVLIRLVVATSADGLHAAGQAFRTVHCREG